MCGCYGSEGVWLKCVGVFGKMVVVEVVVELVMVVVVVGLKVKDEEEEEEELLLLCEVVCWVLVGVVVEVGFGVVVFLEEVVVEEFGVVLGFLFDLLGWML